MEPIAESAEVLRRLTETSETDLEAALHDLALHVVELIPQCVGLSISYFDNGVTVTFLATVEQLRILDAAQYLEGGPCVDAAEKDEVVSVPGLMDEDRWSLLAQAGASTGVRSSLSLPLRNGADVYGSVNLYGRTTDAFQGHESGIAEIFATQVGDAVTNADLSMASLNRARQGVAALESHDVMNRAAGLLASKENIAVQDAFTRLDEAASRAAVSPVDLANLVLRQRDL
jgi:GAF domain-containing protein